MKSLSKNQLWLIGKLFILFLIFYFPFFLDLGIQPIRLWDESRIAVNTYEMSKSGNWLVSTFNGQPDMWNTKPPLLIWIQVLFSRVYGMNELAIRLPSAIAGFLTIVALFLFSVKYLKEYWFGVISGLVLVTTYQFIGIHAARTGDYDAMLTLFTTLYCLFLFMFVETDDRRYLHLFFLSLLLAIMTKGIQALVFLPALTIYAGIRKKLLSFLQTRWFYIDLLGVILLVGGFYLAREAANPGYIKTVWMNEIGGRYSSAIENHQSDFWFYYRNLTGYLFSDWHWLVPCGVAVGFFIRDARMRKVTLFSCVLILTYWLVISCGGTKIEWYEIPMFPFLAMLISVFLTYIFSFLKSQENIARSFRFNVIPYIFIFIVFMTPYSSIINKVYKPNECDEDKEFFRMSYYLREALKGDHDVKGHYICCNGYTVQFQLYLNQLNDQSRQVGLNHLYNLKPGDRVIASQDAVKDSIESNYNAEVTENVNFVKKYRINGPKSAQ